MATWEEESRWSHRQEILDSTVRIEKGSAHGPVNIRPRESHALHIGGGGLALATHSQG